MKGFCETRLSSFCEAKPRTTWTLGILSTRIIMNYPSIINNSRRIGNGFDAFATVHRFSSDLHFKTLPSIIDGLWIFVLKNKLLFKLLIGCSYCLPFFCGANYALCIMHYALTICAYHRHELSVNVGLLA